MAYFDTGSVTVLLTALSTFTQEEAEQVRGVVIPYLMSLTDAFESHVSQFKPVQLVQVAVTFVIYKYCPIHFLQKLATEVEEKLAELTPVDLAKLVKSFAQLGSTLSIDALYPKLSKQVGRRLGMFEPKVIYNLLLQVEHQQLKWLPLLID